MKSQSDMLMEAFERSPMLRAGDLTSAGIHFHTIRDALENDEIVKLAPGLYCTILTSTDQDVDYAALHAITGGVVYGLTAASLHNLSNATRPSKIKLIVPNSYNNRIRGMAVDMWRTRNRKNLEVGVEEFRTHSGLTFKTTNEARTVVDLYRDQGRGQFARDALSDFFERGGSESELKRIAEEFKVWPHIAAHTEMMSYYRDRGIVPK